MSRALRGVLIICLRSIVKDFLIFCAHRFPARVVRVDNPTARALARSRAEKFSAKQAATLRKLAAGCRSSGVFDKVSSSFVV